MSKVRILVADDHPIVRRGLQDILKGQEGWEICAEVSTGREAVEKAKSLKPEIAILDLAMPELNGLEAARQIRKASPATEVMILTMHESDQVVREVLASGARAYVLKSDAGRELVAAIEALLQGRLFFTSKVSNAVIEACLRSGNEASSSRLTPREREAVQLLAEGKSTKEVAAHLGISVKSAETHRSNLMRKLGLHSVSDLVRYAIRNRIVEP